MTISNERIEREVEAEVKRITAWNGYASEESPCPDICAGYGVHEEDGPLCPHQILGLANHLVRNRMQADIVRIEAEEELLKAAKAARDFATTAQGQWAGVLYPYAPEWTEPFKNIVEGLDTAIAQAEVNP